MGILSWVILLLMASNPQLAMQEEDDLRAALDALACTPERPTTRRALTAELDEAAALANAVQALNSRPRPDSINPSPEAMPRRRKVVADTVAAVDKLCNCTADCPSRLPVEKVEERMESLRNKSAKQRHEWVFNDLDNASMLAEDGTRRYIETR